MQESSNEVDNFVSLKIYRNFDEYLSNLNFRGVKKIRTPPFNFSFSLKEFFTTFNTETIFTRTSSSNTFTTYFPSMLKSLGA